MLVYAQEEQKDTIAICEQLRKDPEGATAPILLVVGRYKMSHFHELRRRMENITSIITPFDQKIYAPGLTKFLAPLSHFVCVLRIKNNDTGK